MLTITAGEDEDKLILDIPVDSLKDSKREETIGALSRFVVALNGNGELLEEDVATVLSIDGMLMTLPGTTQPISMQEVLGGLIVSGSPTDIAEIQQASEQ